MDIFKRQYVMNELKKNRRRDLRPSLAAGSVCETNGNKILRWFLDRYIKKEFIKLSVCGNYCIQPPMEAITELLNADEISDYKIESVKMTEKKYKSLPEFMGY